MNFFIFFAVLTVCIVGLVTYFVSNPPEETPFLQGPQGPQNVLSQLSPEDEEKFRKQYKIMNTITNMYLFLPGILCCLLGFYIEGIILLVGAVASTIYHIVETDAWRIIDVVFGILYLIIMVLFFVRLFMLQPRNPMIWFILFLSLPAFALFWIGLWSPDHDATEEIQARLYHSIWHIGAASAGVLLISQFFSFPAHISNKNFKQYVLKTQANYRTRSAGGPSLLRSTLMDLFFKKSSTIK